jgi:ABC-2 type transport system ATP-binding protein
MTPNTTFKKAWAFVPLSFRFSFYLSYSLSCFALNKKIFFYFHRFKPMQLQQTFISDLQNSIRHHDISLLTRRLMDLSDEFKIEETQRFEIVRLRKAFLDLNDTEDETNHKIEITDSAKRLLENLQIESLKPTKPQASALNLVVEAENISKQFHRGRNPFKLHSLNVRLKEGEITGVVGENGNGKTTLLRMLAGELSCDTGQVIYPALQTDNNGAFDWYAIKNKLAFIPQRIHKWHGTLLDNLCFYATIHGIKGSENEKHIDYILYRLGLDRFRDLKWNEISSGYRLRFELAKMLLWKPKLLILDEPLANLDINAQQLLLQDLRFFTQSVSHPMAIILSSQNLHEIEKVADNIIFIRQGKTIYNGQQQDFALNREQNIFELSGKFDFESVSKCFANRPEFKVENAGTSFILTTGTECTIYQVTRLLEENGLELSYIRNISQSTRKLFHKDI